MLLPACLACENPRSRGTAFLNTDVNSRPVELPPFGPSSASMAITLCGID
jgi:hypothetical protein